MDVVDINIHIEDGIITIHDNLGNESAYDFDPDITISDQIGTYTQEHVEANNIYSEIISEGIDNQDYVDGYYEDDDDFFDD